MRINRLSRLIFAGALNLGMISGSIAMADSAAFDPARGDTACDIVTREIVAGTLDAAPANVQQMALSPTMCSYQMEGDVRILEVTAMVRAFATKAAASEFYGEFTRDVSPEEMTERLQELGVDTDDPSSIADRSVAARLTDGIRFEEVEGIADQARFDASEGTLHLRQETIVLSISAFHGPPPMLPAKIAPEAIADAEAAWKAETMKLRREQASDLANAALNAL